MLIALLLMARVAFPTLVCDIGYVGCCWDNFDPPPCTSCPCPPGSGGGGGGGGGGGCNNCPASLAAAGGSPEWSVSEPFMNLKLEDRPLGNGYQPSRGPRVSFVLYYRQRGAVTEDPALFGVGKNWSCSLRAYVVPLSTPSGAVLLHRGGAGWVRYITGQTQVRDGSLMTATAAGYEIEYSDGGKDTFTNSFTASSGVTYYFMTSQSDAAGNTVIYTYSSNSGVVQLLTIADADGLTTTLTYANTTYPYQITKVTDPFGRYCQLRYDGQGYLTNIVDAVGISTLFTYDPGTLDPTGLQARRGWITTMTTPYGPTTFGYGGVDADSSTFSQGNNQINRYVQVTLPNGGHHLFLYRHDCSLILDQTYAPVPSTAPLANTLDNVDQRNRNSFHWDPLGYSHLSAVAGMNGDPNSLLPSDYRLARLRHWLIDPLTSGTSSTLSVERAPSMDGGGNNGMGNGQLVWYDYDGKPSGVNNEGGTNDLPSIVAQVLPDGTTRFTHYARGVHSEVTQEISTYSATNGAVALRTNTFIYAANDIDLKQQIGPQGEQVVSNYFAAGNVYHQPDARYDALNQPTVYTYNTDRQLTSAKTPGGLTTTNLYFASGTYANWLDKTIDLEISRTNSFTYAFGLVQTHTDERGLTVTNFWDNLIRLTGMTYPDGSSISNAYTALDLTGVKDRLGNWTRSGFNSVRQKIAETNANGVVTGYAYCDCGALLAITNAWNTAVQQVTTFQYDNAGNRTNTVAADGFSVTNWFNSLAQPIVTGDGWGYRWFYYNNQGLLTNVLNAVGNENVTLYDSEDRPVFVTDASGVTLTNTYDSLGRVKARKYPDGGTETFGYAAAGLIAYTNQIGASNFFALDVTGKRLFETNANNQLIQYNYDPSGNLTNLVDGKAQATRWNFDEYGRVTNKLDQAGVEVLRYKYDADGRLTNRWSAAKANTYYRYDPVGNLTDIVYPVSTNVAMSYDELNRLIRMVDASGTNLFTYTQGNQLLTEDGPFANDVVSNTYLNRLRTGLSLQQPVGSWTNGFGYDAAKRLTNVTSQAGSFTNEYFSGVAGLSGYSSKLVRRLLLPNLSIITNNYDSVGRLLETSLRTSTGTLLDSATYGYSSANQRTAFTNAAGAYYQYTYDNISQLTVADSSVNSEDRGYLYDAAWNLNWRTNNGSTLALTVDAKNQLSTTATTNRFNYDGNGSLGSITNAFSNQTLYNYDDENRLISWYWYTNGAGSGGNPSTADDLRSEFVYDGLGRLRKRVEYTASLIFLPHWVATGTNLYIYDGNRVIQERLNVNPSVSYTRGNDLSGTLEGAGGIGGLLARSHGYSAANGNFSTHNYYHADGNGNITYIVNSSQALAASYRYDPFGNKISSSGTLANANVYRFSSKEIHAASSMYYYGYRFYDPNLQRWINREPLGDLGHRTQTEVAPYTNPFQMAAALRPDQSPLYGDIMDPNAYRFIGNDAVDQQDFDGRKSLLIICVSGTATFCSDAVICISALSKICSMGVICSAGVVSICSVVAVGCSVNIGACSVAAACSLSGGFCSLGAVCSLNFGHCSLAGACSHNVGPCSAATGICSGKGSGQCSTAAIQCSCGSRCPPPKPPPPNPPPKGTTFFPTGDEGCLIARGGTQLQIVDLQPKPIERIGIGDRIVVISRDSLAPVTVRVSGLSARAGAEVCEISTTVGEIVVTPQTFVRERGRGLLPARSLKEGDTLIGENQQSSAKILAIRTYAGSGAHYYVLTEQESPVYLAVASDSKSQFVQGLSVWNAGVELAQSQWK